MTRWLMLRMTVSVALAASFAVAAAPVLAHPTVEVANPRPNDRLTPGSLIMQGLAFDRDANIGAGIDHVSIFICPRGEGGQYLGEATLGQPSTMPTPSVQFAFAGWVFKTPALRGAGDQRSLCVFALSSVTGAETLVRVPITIGERPPKHDDAAQPIAPTGAGTGAARVSAGVGPGAGGAIGGTRTTGGESGPASTTPAGTTPSTGGGTMTTPVTPTPSSGVTTTTPVTGGGTTQPPRAGPGGVPDPNGEEGGPEE